MKTNKPRKKNKDFDAVQMMREIRDKVNAETKGMSFEELRKYIDSKLLKKTKLIGQ